MAELSAATQSPSVSSSSSGAEPSAPGSGSPGSCPTLGAKSCGSSCADSFVSSSSSQPVSLFSTSQEGMSSPCSGEPPSEILTSSFLASSEIRKTDLAILSGEQSRALGSQPVLAEGEDCSALLDLKRMEKSQGTGKDGANSPVPVGEGGRCHRPPVPASFPGHPALLSEEAVQMEEQRNKDQGSKNPSEIPSRNDKPVLDANDKFTLLAARNPPTELSGAEGAGTHALSPSKVAGGGAFEKDSPESPFEVIIDRAAFDKEYKDAYKESANDFGSWAVRTDGESSADTSESNDRVFPLRNKEAGRFPAALLARQFSHTTAALEEVSRCVSDMHNFTNEVLTWDFVPPVKQQNDRADYVTKTPGLDTSKYNSEIPVVNLKTNTHQKIPVRSVNGSTPIAKLTGNWAEASLPRENAAVEKPVPDRLGSTADASVRGVQGSVQKPGDALSEVPASPFEECVSLGSGVAAGRVVLPDGPLKGEVSWQSPVLGDATEADSSGESDDTVIEDITASISFESNKIQAKKPVSIPSAVIKADEKEIKEILNYNRETETSENFEGPVSDFEPQSKPDTLARSPAGAAAGSQAASGKVLSGDGRPSDGTRGGPEKAAAAEDPRLPSPAPSPVTETEFSPNVTASAHSESLRENIIEDTGDSSPEDLVTTLTEAGEKGAVDKSGGNALEATSEQAVDFKTLPAEVLYACESGASGINDIKSKYSQQNKEIRASERPGVSPALGAAVAALDLEQEQLTIRALRELSGRQTEEPAPARGEVEPASEGTRRQASTFAPESSQPQRSHGVREPTGVKGSALGTLGMPAVTKEATGVGVDSSRSEPALASARVLAGLLTHATVHDLIFWRDVKKTGFVFGTTLVVLLSLAAFSVISVVSYLILALLFVTISFRVYKSVIQAVQKSEEGHPFKAYLDVDITLSPEAFHSYVNAALAHANRALKLIVRLFLVEDLVDSLKLAVFMWLMTYVGAVFNGITLLILAELLVFSVPIVYEKYKTQIDHYVGIARDQTKAIVEKIQAKLPGIAKKKAE